MWYLPFCQMDAYASRMHVLLPYGHGWLVHCHELVVNCHEFVAYCHEFLACYHDLLACCQGFPAWVACILPQNEYEGSDFDLPSKMLKLES